MMYGLDKSDDFLGSGNYRKRSYYSSHICLGKASARLCIVRGILLKLFGNNVILRKYDFVC